MTEYKEYFDKIKEFKKSLDAESEIEASNKDIVFKSFLDNLFKGTVQQVPILKERESKQQLQQESFTQSDDQAFAGLINKTKFNQHPDIVLLAIYYLVKCKNYTGVTLSEIEEQYRSALIKKSSNTRMFINVNKKKGYIMDAEPKEDKSAWVLTRDGLNYIEEVLANGS